MQRENLASIRRKVGYIFQDSDSQLFMPTVAADVAFAAQNYGYPTEEVAARTHRALPQVHIEDCADRPVYRLSGGQKKLASIAGILTLDPAADLDGRAVRRAGPEKPAQLNRNFAGTALCDADCLPRSGFYLRYLRPGGAAVRRAHCRRRPGRGNFARWCVASDCDLELPLRFQSI